MKKASVFLQEDESLNFRGTTSLGAIARS